MCPAGVLADVHISPVINYISFTTSGFLFTLQLYLSTHMSWYQDRGQCQVACCVMQCAVGDDFRKNNNNAF